MHIFESVTVFIFRISKSKLIFRHPGVFQELKNMCAVVHYYSKGGPAQSSSSNKSLIIGIVSIRSTVLFLDSTGTESTCPPLTYC